MSRFVKILVWVAIAAYIVATGVGAHNKRAGITVAAMRIVVVDTTRVVTAEKVTRWLSAARIDPIGQSVDSAAVHSIEASLGAHPEVRHVSAWTDLDGTLTIRVTPRVPAMRVRTAGGYRFWFTHDGVIMPDRGDFAARTAVVTGNVAWPFPPTAQGDYAAIRAADRGDFLKRFEALAAERRTLEDRLATNRAETRSVRNSTPGRLRSRSYKELFSSRKATLLKELESARAQIVTQIAALDRQEAALREKEKKSYQSHRFLSKLANFVQFIERNDFWAAQVVQINVTGGSGNGVSPDKWKEPQVELIPRAGDHVILLGELDGTESERLANLRTFYERAMWQEGWDTYHHINIRYANQIVCTK